MALGDQRFQCLSSYRTLRHLDACATVPAAVTQMTLPSDAPPPSHIEPQSRQPHGLPSMLTDVAYRPSLTAALLSACSQRPTTATVQFALT